MSEQRCEAYRVDVDKEGCKHCGGGTYWTIVGPDDVGIGTSWADQMHAEDICDLMNMAFDAGEEKRGTFDFLAHLRRQREFSERTFGPGARTKGVIDHIRKELREIDADPADISEWVDVTILALDGAWRAGYSPEQIIAALVAKQEKNEARQWPDWRAASEDKAIEHIKESK